MIDRDDRRPGDVLDRATEALRDAPVPDGPPPQLGASTVEALKSSKTPPDVVRREQRRKLMSRIARYGAAVAAAALLVVLVGYFWFTDRGAGFAFADVIENVRKAESVSFVLKQKLGGQPVITARMYIQGQGFRMDMVGVEGVNQEAAEKLKKFPALVSFIADVTKKEQLQLDHVRKTATRAKVDDRAASEFTKANPVEQFRKIKQEDAESIGQEQRGGRTLQVYRLTAIDLMGIKGKTDQAGDEMKIWVDQQTGLPVRIRIAGAFSRDRNDESFLDFDQFVWNQPLDPALFSLETPEGYTLQEGRDGLPDAKQ